MLNVLRKTRGSQRTVAMVAMLALCGLPVEAQSVDLTGRPSATITEPFTQIAGVREVWGNQAVVTDQIERRVVLADFGRGTVRVIGRQGEGPAEYRFPMRPVAAPGTISLVADASLARILVISPDGRITSKLKMPTDERVGELTELKGVDSRGRLYFETNSFNPESGRFSDSVAIVRLDATGSNAKVLARISNGGRVVLKLASGPASLARSITPFPHIDTWIVLPNGSVAVIHPGPYSVDVVDSAGARHTGTAIPYTPIPVTAKDRSSVRDSASHVRSAATTKGGGPGPRGPGSVLPDELFPKVMPAYLAGSAQVSPAGHFWVGRSHSITEASVSYDIFDGTGKRIGTARLKAHSIVVGFGVGSVYIARQDPTSDLVYLEKYSIK
jgi:hypothetical protein